MDPSHHLGHLVYKCFKTRPDEICQIDAATGKKETNASVLARSTALARSLRNFGLVVGDVLAICGRHHLDIYIPYYAALFNGLPMLGIDPYYKFDEIKHILKVASPKIVFCDPDKYEDFVRASEELQLSTEIVTFDTMANFVENNQGTNIADNFKVATVDLDNTPIWLICTSGTTGKSKIAVFSHRAWLQKTLAFIQVLNDTKANVVELKDTTNGANKPSLNLSSISWISGIVNAVSMPLQNQCMLQTSAAPTVEHVIDMINTYKPVYVLIGPSMLSYILKNEKKCDLTCFDTIVVGGAKVNPELIIEAKKRVRTGVSVTEMHGQTETLGLVFYPTPDTPLGSCGIPITKMYRVKLVDPDTGDAIKEPFKTGEVWTSGIHFSCYYNDPAATAEAFHDEWFKTGDMMYRNEDDQYFFVERRKLLIKYQNYHITPKELEEVIMAIPGVLDVVVTSIPHAEDGEHAVACVVREPEATVTAQEIKEVVARKLSPNKQLRGGVVFLNEMPMTTSLKPSIPKLKEIILTAERQ